MVCEHDVESDRLHLLAAIKGGDPGLDSDYQRRCALWLDQQQTVLSTGWALSAVVKIELDVRVEGYGFWLSPFNSSAAYLAARMVGVALIPFQHCLAAEEQPVRPGAIVAQVPASAILLVLCFARCFV
jgi:hypothetical protein